MSQKHYGTATTGAIKWSIATGVFLSALKLSAAFFTNSMAIFASALDSVMDVAASTVNFIAARKAAEPPDEEHTYGHGKIESLASLFQSLLIGVSGLFLVCESVKRFFLGTEISIVPLGVATMIISIIVTWFLVLYLKKRERSHASLILSTERLHFSSDLFSNLGVVLALILVQITGHVAWDLLLSIGVAIYILKQSLYILRRSIDELLDKSLPKSLIEKIQKIIFGFHPSIVGIHNFRSHRVGTQIFMDFHIEIRGEDDFKTAHDRTEALIRRIEEDYPESDINVHYDPEGED